MAILGYTGSVGYRLLAYQKVKCLFVELPRCYHRAAIGGQCRSFPERERSCVWRPTR